MSALTRAAGSAFDRSCQPSHERGFPDRRFHGWTTSGDVEVFQSAVYWNGGDSPANGVVSQVIGTTPGQTYSLEFDSGVLSFTGATQSLKVEVIDSAGQIPFNETVTDPTPLTPRRSIIIGIPSPVKIRRDHPTTTRLVPRCLSRDAVQEALDHHRRDSNGLRDCKVTLQRLFRHEPRSAAIGAPARIPGGRRREHSRLRANDRHRRLSTGQ